MVLTIVILSLVIGFLIIEAQIIKRSVTGLQLRIHVNGTRGKSSVTKYIAAGLSKSDPAVMAKVTGVVPSITISGGIQVLGRTGVARVQEQFHVIRLAASKGIKMLILECMSISPDLQQLESRHFKPHYYVITNIKDDHREDMGMSLQQQAESICNAIPRNCTVVTNEACFIDLIRKKAAEKGSIVIVPEIIDPDQVSKLPSGVFPENVALAITVCKLEGIEIRETEEAILESLINDPPVHSKIVTGNKELGFLNAFAVNDVDSTESFIEYWREKLNAGKRYTVLFNTRADRPLRTDQLTAWMNSRADRIDRILITGSHGRRAVIGLKRSEIDNEYIFLLKKRDLNNLKARLNDLVPDGSLIIGLGNIGEHGHKIMEALV